jgi:flagellar biosynthesis/type III secretory pathway chaperone
VIFIIKRCRQVNNKNKIFLFQAQNTMNAITDAMMGIAMKK